MKHIYTLIVLLFGGFSLTAQYGQFENGGFENWTNNNLYDYTTVWQSSNQQEFQGTAAILKSTDAQLGTYSCEIRAESNSSNDTIFGYVFHGSVGQMGPDAGIPYTDAFDEVKFQYKSNLLDDDTLYVLAIRFNLGTMTGMYMAPAVWDTQGAWTAGSASIPAGVQDSLFIGFIMGDPFYESELTPGSWARIDNIEMYNLGNPVTNLPDPSFESWASVSVETPDNWYSLNEFLAGIGLENATKTTDANSGTYAIELTTVLEPSNNDSISSMLSNSPINIYGPGGPFNPAPYNASPTTLSFAYKFAPSGVDQGAVMIEFYEMGNSIGAHQEFFVTPQSTWTTLTIPLTITGTPDSMAFMSFSGQNPGTILKLDDVSLSGGNVSVEEFSTMEATIYPNPASNRLMVKAEGVYDCEIVDLSGKTVLSANELTDVQELQIDHLNSGSYFVRIMQGEAIETIKLVIK